MGEVEGMRGQRGGIKEGLVGEGGVGTGWRGILAGGRKTWDGPELHYCRSGPPQKEDWRGQRGERWWSMKGVGDRGKEENVRVREHRCMADEA